MKHICFFDDDQIEIEIKISRYKNNLIVLVTRIYIFNATKLLCELKKKRTTAFRNDFV